MANEPNPEQRRRKWLDVARMYGISIAMSFVFTLFFTMGEHPMIRLSPFVTAFLYGIPYGTTFILLDRSGLTDRRFPSFVVTTAFRTGAFAGGLSLAFFVSISLTIMVQGKTGPLNLEVYRTAGQIMLMPVLAYTYALAFIIVFVINACFAVSRKLGPGIVWNWLRGYYHQPREEERIFMFLDMKDSTTLAEQLGNLRFSALVRDFFQDMTSPVIETRGEVSHYIGDEAVLTWRMDRGLPCANCLRCFFLMKASIAKRASYYQATYGLIPDFKAGVHCGLVVATEVGEIKSEIVFHGDVLNTAARIQGLCNELGTPLLISEEVFQKLGPNDLHFRPMGERILKGKEHSVQLYQVSMGPTLTTDR